MATPRATSDSVECFNKQFNYSDLTSLMWKYFFQAPPDGVKPDGTPKVGHVINVAYTTPASSLPPHLQRQVERDLYVGVREMPKEGGESMK